VADAAPADHHDIPWVYEVSLDPVLQHFVQVPSPYRLEDAASFVEQVAIAGRDNGRRAEFVAEDAAAGMRLGGSASGLVRLARPRSGTGSIRGPAIAVSPPARSGGMPLGRDDGRH
jgi:hypothetical protein